MITALVLQTWFDIAIQSTGSVVNAYAIAMANGRSVTNHIIAGESIRDSSGNRSFEKRNSIS
ncbi:hypothetical protein [Flavobacterium sp. GNP002]